MLACVCVKAREGDRMVVCMSICEHTVHVSVCVYVCICGGGVYIWPCVYEGLPACV